MFIFKEADNGVIIPPCLLGSQQYFTRFFWEGEFLDEAIFFLGRALLFFTRLTCAVYSIDIGQVERFQFLL